MGATGSHSTPDGESGEGQSEASDPLELFFDLVFVFAFTRVTAVVAHEQTWGSAARSVAVLTALWWAWVTYTWLMDSIHARRVPPERVIVLSATAIMFVVALAIPNAFGETAVLFGVAYLAVRVLHVAFTLQIAGSVVRHRFYRLVPGFLGGPALILVAGFADGGLQGALWIAGLAIDFGVLFVRGVAKFEVRPEHFVERYRDVVVIALGESVLAMGFGIAGDDPALSPVVVTAALLGIVLVAALAWLYFDYVTLAAEDRFVATHGYERGAVARDSYAYLHLPIVAGILFVAIGLEVVVTHTGETLSLVPAVSLYGGSALYLLGHTAYRLYDAGHVSLTRPLAAGAVALLLVPALRVPAVTALAGLTTLLVGLAVFETAFSPLRRDVRGTDGDGS